MHVFSPSKNLANGTEGKLMAKAKHQKSKPSRQAKQTNTRKRGGKQNDVPELSAQLDALGLKIIHVTADGNCLFRALADQLDGDEDEHQKYRSTVVKFLKEQREMFEPFVEDDVPYEDYCELMEEDGTWAGNMELQAASLVTGINICIHRHMSPRWYLNNFDEREARMIHLSFHDEEHYNSVRSKDDTCSGPARPIVIKGDADVSTKSDRTKASARKSSGEDETNAFNEDTIELAKAGSGCEDARKVEQALQQVGGDVDAAIEVLVAEQGSSDQIIAEDESSSLVKTSSDESRYENSDQHMPMVEDNINNPDLSGNDVEKSTQKNRQPDEKKISRNKACPCGSKKKYKSCCGTVSGRSSARLPVNQRVDYGKIRKDRKQGRKGGVIAHSEGVPPDMGALCI